MFWYVRKCNEKGWGKENGMNYVGSIENDSELIFGTKKILIYGAGKYGKRVYRNLIVNGRNKDVVAFVETVSKNNEEVDYWGGYSCYRIEKSL